LDINNIILEFFLIEDYLDLVGNILYTNHLAKDFSKYYKMAKINQDNYQLEDRLFKKNRYLVVAEAIYTALLIRSHYYLTTIYPGKNKTKALVKKRYY